MEEKALYYGPYEVVSIEVDGELVTMTLKPEGSEDTINLKVPQAVYDRVKTEERKDWNYVRDTKLNTAISEIIEVFKKNGVTGGELKYTLEQVGRQFITVIDQALHFKFRGELSTFVPGGDLYFDYTLAEAHAALKDSNVGEKSGTDTAA